MSSIDIVIPCYRYGRYLRDCVQSVLTQGVADLRVLVIDDESPDDTPEIGAALAMEDARVSYRRHDVNRGHIATYNEGIDWTRADYMLLLSADDYLLPGALQRALGLLRERPEVGLCFGQALELHDDGRTQPMTVPIDTGRAASAVIAGADFVRSCVRAGATNIVPTPTAIVKTALLKQLGGYRPDLPHTGDLELWLRLASHAPVGIVKTDLAVYRRHAANMSLAYHQDGGLADLKQRQAAFDVFLQGCRGVLPDAATLHGELMRALGQEAVGYASSAFNRNRMDLSERLCDFAVAASPGVRHGLAWNVLASKKLMGFRLSRALLPAVTRIRAVTARLRGWPARTGRRA